ncbi:hypothetical protein [Pseudoalteromonas rubra]|uniref:hypothetical protein n=1 Tax=Pseudoalteromonas rubra TaxID=43658 RepID=UPI00026C948E|nr:hypothetical protein [Pseudoalteromonas rubra]
MNEPTYSAIGLEDYTARSTGFRPEEMCKIVGEIKTDTRKVQSFISLLREFCIGMSLETMLIANG